MSDAAISASAHPRVGLAGNPSDLYRGAVVAFTFTGFSTTVTLEDAAGWMVPSDGAQLVEATLRRVAHHHDLGPPARITIETDVPRQAGLSGSSAIVVALLRALAHRADRRAECYDVAADALAVEHDDLGVVAGAQDRVAQAYGGLVVVDVADGLTRAGIRRLDPALLPPLVVAWSERPGRPSGDVHAPVRRRWLAGDPEVVAAAARWRELAGEAEGALVDGDRARLAAVIDENLALRTRIFPVDERDLRMVAVAREAGGAAKLCGSGGSIVALARDPDGLDQLEQALRGSGFRTLRPVFAPPIDD